MKYYHFTPIKNTLSINIDGLKAQPVTMKRIDNNYKVTEINGNLVFLAKDINELRTQINYKYSKEDYHKIITVYEVDSEYLTADKTDYHNKGKVIVYSDNIPATAFTNIWTVSVGIAMVSDFK